MQNITETTVTHLQTKLDSNDEFLLIDVREDNEWREGYLPNAIHVSKGTIERDIHKVAPDKETSIILYCGGGYRSALAADALQRMGYTNILSLQGGIKAWLNAGLPVNTP